tara:strand:- start:1603 stop:2382 length:780 start_codon:yes stop_codon:yes gene_type:complete
VNSKAALLKNGGKVLGVAGVAVEVVNVATAPEGEKGQEAARATGRIAGGLAGAKLLAPAGAAGGPWGVAGAAFIGGVGGSIGGESFVDAIINNEGTGKPYRHEPTYCFVAGTKIIMWDETVKNIEDLSVGDTVLSWDEEGLHLVAGQVVELFSPVHHNFALLTFEGSHTKNTLDHPFYVKGKGWCSVLPDLTKTRYRVFDDTEISKLEAGDVCYMLVDGKLEESSITSIVVEEETLQTYNFRVNKYHTYFANFILVHNK